MHCVKKCIYFYLFDLVIQEKVIPFLLPQSYNWLRFFILFFQYCISIMHSTRFKPYYRDYSFGDSSKFIIILVYMVFGPLFHSQSILTQENAVKVLKICLHVNIYWGMEENKENPKYTSVLLILIFRNRQILSGRWLKLECVFIKIRQWSLILTWHCFSCYKCTAFIWRVS